MNQRILLRTADDHAPVVALAAATLLGMSIAAAKLMIVQVSPWLFAGLLYLGSGLSLSAWFMARHIQGLAFEEARGKARDIGRLVGAIVFGGFASPVLFLLGVAISSRAHTSIFLNLETLAILAVASVVFRQSLDRWVCLGAAVIISSTILLSWSWGLGSFSVGLGLIAAASLCWGIDNHFSRQLSGIDPVAVTAIKGLVAGGTNIGLAFAQGASLPGTANLVGSLLLGVCSYGLSLLPFILLVKALASPKAIAFRGTSPVIGAVASLVLLGQPLTGGVWFHVAELHNHDHIRHDHRRPNEMP